MPLEREILWGRYYKRAKTTHAIRKELQRLKATIKELSERYNFNPKTVLKWKRRETIEDSPMGPKCARTILSEQEEAMICAFRRKTQLPLDDCYIALKNIFLLYLEATFIDT